MPTASRTTLALWSVVILVATVASVPRLADVLPLPERLAGDREGAREALASIRLEDGLSREEAPIVATVYFYTYVGACGGAFNPREEAGSWVFDILVGSAGAYSGNLQIQASTGRMTRDREVLFSSFEEFRKDAVDHFGRRVWYSWLRRL